MIEYLMEEDREALKEKEEVEGSLKAQGKYTTDINFLNCQLKHAKKEQKEDAVQFEQQLQMIMQKLNDRENNWSEEHKKLSEEAVEMITDLQKLWTEMDEQKTEIKKREKSSTEMATVEFRYQLTILKMEAQVQNKQLQKKKVIASTHTQIDESMETLRNKSQKAMLHMWKIIEEF